MELRTDTIIEILQHRAERLYYCGVDYAANYGGRENDSQTAMVLVVDGWDVLAKLGLTRRGEPAWRYESTRFAHAAEAAGIETVFSDEYAIDYGESLAWRMQPDSYGWTAQAFYSADGELITVDDDPTVILRAKAWDESGVELSNGAVFFGLGESFAHALRADEPKFTPWPGRELENGWHPGQDDDPVAGAERIARICPTARTIVAMYQPSQFYVSWRYYVSATDVRQ